VKRRRRRVRTRAMCGRVGEEESEEEAKEEEKKGVSEEEDEEEKGEERTNGEGSDAKFGKRELMLP
jgi:hypothetical protein